MDNYEKFVWKSSDVNVLGVCHKCKHKKQNGLTCEAFPKNIPDDILTGKIKHDHIIDGQKGKFVFEAK